MQKLKCTSEVKSLKSYIKFRDNVPKAYYHDQINDYIEAFKEDEPFQDFNKVMELHNVYLIVRNLFIEEWNLFENKARGFLGKYFSGFSLLELNDSYKDIHSMYNLDFWDAIINYQLIKKTSVCDFKLFIEQNNVPVNNIVCFKILVNKYSSVIKKILLSNPINFEIAIDKYNAVGKNSVYLPKITGDEFNNWAKRYCEYSTANIFYLEQIVQWSHKHDMKIKDKIKIMAKKCYVVRELKRLTMQVVLSLDLKLNLERVLRKL